MSFNPSHFQDKLNKLTNTQDAIQQTSAWMQHHHRHAFVSVKFWADYVTQTAQTVQYLPLLYLANDVMQNSRKRGPEFAIEFPKYLNQVIQHVFPKVIPDHKQRIHRLLQIWKSRGVLPSDYINSLCACLKLDSSSSNNGNKTSSPSPRVPPSSNNPRLHMVTRIVHDVIGAQSIIDPILMQVASLGPSSVKDFNKFAQTLGAYEHAILALKHLCFEESARLERAKLVLSDLERLASDASVSQTTSPPSGTSADATLLTRPHSSLVTDPAPHDLSPKRPRLNSSSPGPAPIAPQPACTLTSQASSGPGTLYNPMGTPSDPMELLKSLSTSFSSSSQDLIVPSPCLGSDSTSDSMWASWMNLPNSGKAPLTGVTSLSPVPPTTHLLSAPPLLLSGSSNTNSSVNLDNQ